MLVLRFKIKIAENNGTLSLLHNNAKILLGSLQGTFAHVQKISTSQEKNRILQENVFKKIMFVIFLYVFLPLVPGWTDLFPRSFSWLRSSGRAGAGPGLCCRGRGSADPAYLRPTQPADRLPTELPLYSYEASVNSRWPINELSVKETCNWPISANKWSIKERWS